MTLEEIFSLINKDSIFFKEEGGHIISQLSVKDMVLMFLVNMTMSMIDGYQWETDQENGQWLFMLCVRLKGEFHAVIGLFLKV